MILQSKTLERLRILINEETEYRSGPSLIKFFNDLGSRDIYASGFPSRWVYTDSKLSEINGKPELDKCIKKVFAPVNFIGRYNELDNFIKDFNQYLAFDGWRVVRDGKEITFKKAGEIDFESSETLNGEDVFLQKEFKEVSIDSIGLESTVTEVIKTRLEEIKKCLSVKSSMATIFLCGSTLEGILLGLAIRNPVEFNSAKSTPKNEKGEVKKIHEWSLSSFINITYELGYIKEDVKKFSHSLRDFRNYIHPYQQVSSNFYPDQYTSKICWQVLKASIYQISQKCSSKS